jgi:transposase
VRVSLSKYLRNRYGVKFLHFQIPSYLKDQSIDLVILKPQSHGQFKIKFCYEVEEQPKVETSKVLGIDLGTNNLAACVSSDGDAFLFSGKKLKSQNQFYNKKSAEFQSQIDLEKHNLKNEAQAAENISHQEKVEEN